MTAPDQGRTGAHRISAADVVAAAALERESDLVTRPVRIAAAWSWRLLLIAAAAVPLIWIIAQAALIVVPLLVAILLTALLVPITNTLTGKYRWPKGLALIAALLALFAAIAALIGLIVLAFNSGQQFNLAALQDRYRELLRVVENSPLHITEQQVNEWLGEALEWVRQNAGTLIQGTLNASSSVASVVTGSVVAVFAIIFYLLDGRRIWLFLVSFFPASARPGVDGAGERAWISTGHYVRVQVIVALIDALGIFLGALILQVPYALAIGIIVFLAAFVPLVGAVASGAVAVVIALLANGLWNAVFMLIIVVAVMAIEANVLQPLIMGQAVELHPLAVLVSVSAGSLFAGIPGAVFAVPLVAAVRTMVRYIESGRWRGEPDPTVGLDSDDDADPVPKRKPLEIRRRKKASRA